MNKKIFEDIYNKFNEGDCCGACESGATVAGPGDGSGGIADFAPEHIVAISNPAELKTGTTFKKDNIEY